MYCTIISQGDKEENNYDYEIQAMLLCIYWLHVTSNYFVWQNFLPYSCKDRMDAYEGLLQTKHF